MIFLNDNTVVLCGGRRCCPELTLNGDDVTIKDDDGNIVNMKIDQAKLISSAIAEIIKKNDSN